MSEENSIYCKRIGQRFKLENCVKFLSMKSDVDTEDVGKNLKFVLKCRKECLSREEIEHKSNLKFDDNIKTEKEIKMSDKKITRDELLAGFKEYYPYRNFGVGVPVIFLRKSKSIVLNTACVKEYEKYLKDKKSAKLFFKEEERQEEKGEKKNIKIIAIEFLEGNYKTTGGNNAYRDERAGIEINSKGFCNVNDLGNFFNGNGYDYEFFVDHNILKIYLDKETYRKASNKNKGRSKIEKIN